MLVGALVAVGCTGEVQRYQVDGDGSAPGQGGGATRTPDMRDGSSNSEDQGDGWDMVSATPDMGGGTVEPPPVGGPVHMPIRHVTPLQYRNMLHDLFDDRLDSDLFDDADKGAARSGYSTEPAANVSTERSVQQLYDSAEKIALESVDIMPELLPCSANAMDDACFATFLDRYASRAFRRPLTSEEELAMREAYDEAITDGFSEHEALAVTLQLILQMPQFLYVSEQGKARANSSKIIDLTDHEIAQRLGFFILDSLPDEELRRAADAGELHTREQIEAQTRRLLQEHPDASILARLVREWLHLSDTLDKDRETFPDFDAELERSLREELERTFANAIAQDTTLEGLLTQDRVPMNARLARHYGVDAGFTPGADGWATTQLPESHQGLIARPYFLASHASSTSSSHVKRGYTILKQFLCSPTGDIPPDAMSQVPVYPANATSREKSEVLRQQPTCGFCHEMIDNIGLSLEHYDALGQWRSIAPADQGSKPIDDSGFVSTNGTLATTDVAGERFDGKDGLTALLTQSISVQECIPRQWFRYAVGRIEETPEEEVVIEELIAHFERHDANLKELLVAITLTEAFRTRALLD